MAKLLSQQLADLSVRAKNAEDAVAAAGKEAHEKIETHKEQARAAAAKATEKVKQDIRSIGDTAARNWTAVRTKVAADIDSLKAGAARAKHDLDARQAEHHAERLQPCRGRESEGIVSNTILLLVYSTPICEQMRL
jgi:hypothetical protein